MNEQGYLHCDSDHGVRCIPEADVASVLASSWRVPGHDEEVQLDANVEDDDYVPCLELWLGQVGLLAAVANSVDSESHCEVEGRSRHDTKVVDCCLLAYGFSQYMTSLQYVPKVNASPAGTARMRRAVKAQITRYGPSGVPKGCVETQNLVKGNTPCRPASLMRRESPMITAIMLPKDARAMRKFNPRTAPLSPKTLLKNRAAVVRSEFCSSSLGTVMMSVSTYLRLNLGHKTYRQQRKRR